MNKWLTILILICVSFAIGFVACEKEDDDDDDKAGNGDDASSDDDDTTVDDDDATSDDDDVTDDDDATDDDDDDDNDDDVWTDSSTSLMWQKDSDCCYNWANAKSYCQDLDWGGYDDWRFPTISELRTLIRGCTETETGGSCGVTDGCLGSSCLNSPCNGCGSGGGPASGCYWPAELTGECMWYWSSSTVSDQVGKAWYVNFDEGYVSKFSDTYDNANVRCVRP